MINPAKAYTIDEYIEILRRRIWYIIIPFVLIVAGASAYTYFRPPPIQGKHAGPREPAEDPGGVRAGHRHLEGRGAAAIHCPGGVEPHPPGADHQRAEPLPEGAEDPLPRRSRRAHAEGHQDRAPDEKGRVKRIFYDQLHRSGPEYRHHGGQQAGLSIHRRKSEDQGTAGCREQRSS